MLQQAADRVFVNQGIAEYAVRLVLTTRDPGEFGLTDLVSLLDYGASPRASLGLVAATRALALLRGREYAVPEDLMDVARDVLRHRLVLSFEAVADGVDVEDVMTRIIDSVAPPRVAPLQHRDPASFAPSDAEPLG
jgi:MoxR-like ATPase